MDGLVYKIRLGKNHIAGQDKTQSSWRLKHKGMEVKVARSGSPYMRLRVRHKRTRLEEGVHHFDKNVKQRRSFAYSSKTNLSEEAGVKPLSPERKRKSGFVYATESHEQYTPEMFQSESQLKKLGMYKPFLKDPFPESMFVFKNVVPEEEVEKEDLFSCLPDEMILRVFHWLPKANLAAMSSVNRRLNRLSNDETLWKRVDACGRTLVNNHLNSIMSRKPLYVRLSCATMTDLHPQFSVICNQLTHLDLSNAQVNPNILSQFFSAAPNISHLSLEHLVLNQSVVSAMKTFAQTILVLNLTMTYDIPAEPFANFLQKSPKMEELNIGNIKQNWTEQDLLKVAENLPNTLDQLNVAGFRHIMADYHVKTIASRCKHLTHVDLSDCQELTHKSVEYLVNGLSDMYHLCLSRCYNIEATGYHLLQNAKKLQFLQLYTLFKDSSLQMLRATYPNVQINSSLISSVARPTVGIKRSSIWNKRVRD